MPKYCVTENKILNKILERGNYGIVYRCLDIKKP